MDHILRWGKSAQLHQAQMAIPLPVAVITVPCARSVVSQLREVKTEK